MPLARKKRARWIHKKLKALYSFKPKAGHEKPQYRCPFCNRMTHVQRFTELKIPVVDSSIMVYGGYRGIRVIRTYMTSEMRIRVLEAMKEKIEFLYDKLGGENLWLKSNSAWIQGVQNISYLMTDVLSIHQKKNVRQKTGVMRTVQNSPILYAKHVKP
ncbi:hypothetical protein ES705_33261 [subsurface metagenome]